MNKILLFLFSCIICLNGYAYEATEGMMQVPKKSLSIVPLSQENIPEEIKQQIIREEKEMEEKGYFETDTPYAMDLINLKKNAYDEIRQFYKSSNPYDTHLKASIDQIKLAFNFKPLSMVDEKNMIGYAPANTYVRKNDKDIGWTGINLFFSASNIGICSYLYCDLKLSHGVVQLNQETTQAIVNRKPSTYTVSGKPGAGFIYRVSWYEEGKINELECANMGYSKDITQRVIALANQIDKR